MPENLTLGNLHLVIQQAMGWENRHLYRFDVNGNYYGPDDQNEDAITLNQVFKTKSISYVYDFGDWREHTFTLVETVPKMAETLVIAGHGRCPDQDSGGV